jgi:adenine specific DNA methylase Mod
MLFQIVEIEFDFEMEDDEYPSQDYQQRLTSEIIGEIWEADDEDDLVEEITCATGWCIKSFDYIHVLK